MSYSCSDNSDHEKTIDEKIFEENISVRNLTSCFDPSVVPPEYICKTISETSNFTLDRYPGCTFEVDYVYELCTDIFTGFKYLYVTNINLVSHDCQAYNDDIIANSFFGTLESFSSEFDGELTQAVLEQIGVQNVGGFGSMTLTYQTAS